MEEKGSKKGSKKIILITIASVTVVALLITGTVFFTTKDTTDNTASSSTVTSSTVSNAEVADDYVWGIASREQPKTLDEYVPMLAEQFKNTLPKINQIWVGADYSKLECYLITEDKKRAWQVKPDGTYLEIEPQVVLDQAEIEGYADEFLFSVDPNKQAMYVVLSEEALLDTDAYDGALHSPCYDLYITILHESFHKYEQSAKWNYTQTPPERDEYIANTIGRSYRIAMQELLLDAYVYEDKRTEYLGNARYLYDQYNEQFPEEAKNVAVSDKLEGAATYFEYQTGVASMYPEDYFGENNDKLMMSFMKAENENSKVTSSDFGAVTESYTIGAYAGILLDDMGTVPDWQEQVMNDPNASPLSILMKDVEPIEYIVPQEITDAAVEAAAEASKAASEAAAEAASQE